MVIHHSKIAKSRKISHIFEKEDIINNRIVTNLSSSSDQRDIGLQIKQKFSKSEGELFKAFLQVEDYFYVVLENLVRIETIERKKIKDLPKSERISYINVMLIILMIFCKIDDYREFGTFILLVPNLILGKRKNIEPKNAIFRTFDPNDHYPKLLEIDMINDFEVEFSHTVEYDLYGSIIENCLLFQGIS